MSDSPSEDRDDTYDALLRAAAFAADKSGRTRIQSTFADNFPQGWKQLCDAFRKGLSFGLSPLRHDLIKVRYDATGEKLAIAVETSPSLPQVVQKELDFTSNLFVITCGHTCRQCGHAPLGECGCADEVAPVVRKHTVFTGAALSSGVVGSGQDEKGKARLQSVMARLRKIGAERSLAEPDPGWSAKLDELAARHPNFARVVQTTLRSHLALLALTGRTKLPPILLVGPPGIGKTHFASALASEVFYTPFTVLSMAEETNGASLCGSSTFWANSQPGKLLDLLAWGEAADPLVLLDEIDKSSAHREYDPLAGLYALLEADTARTFKDQSIPDLLIDTSHVRWIATANSTSGIPAALMSRLQVFHIEPPGADERVAIAQGMLRSMVVDLALEGEFEDGLPQEVQEELVALSPRQVRRILEVAVGLSVDIGAKSLTLAAWRQACPQKGSRSPMGFSA